MTKSQFHDQQIYLTSIISKVTNKENEVYHTVPVGPTSFKKPTITLFSPSSFSVRALFCICCIIYSIPSLNGLSGYFNVSLDFIMWQFLQLDDFDRFRDTAPLIFTCFKSKCTFKDYLLQEKQDLRLCWKYQNCYEVNERDQQFETRKKEHWNSFPPHEAFTTCTQKNIMAFLGKP